MGTAIAFLAAVLAGLGVGSGGFYLLYLTDAVGMEQYAAQGANLVFFATATLASSILHLLRGHLSLASLARLLFVGLLGTVLGAFLTLRVPAVYARRAFGIFMALGGAYTLFGLVVGSRRRQKQEKGRKRAS